MMLIIMSDGLLNHVIIIPLMIGHADRDSWFAAILAILPVLAFGLCFCTILINPFIRRRSCRRSNSSFGVFHICLATGDGFHVLGIDDKEFDIGVILPCVLPKGCDSPWCTVAVGVRLTDGFATP